MGKTHVFSLVAPSPVPRKRSKRERQRDMLAKKRATEQARKEREYQREAAKQKEKNKYAKVHTVLTVSHSPTYSVLSYKRADGEKENRKPPSAFVSKNEIQSIKSQTRLKNAVNWMLLFADQKRVYSKKGKIVKDKVQHNFYFRLAFITLTLSDTQKHTDEFIKEHMLQPFLYWLTRYYGALYVWKAESQLNGNLHFHITIDTYVHWKSIRAKWNKLLGKYNYCKVFQDGTNDKGDAATQIKSVLSERKCANDIGGYMSKKDRVAEKDKKAIQNKRAGYEDAMVHSKWSPEYGTFDDKTQKWEPSMEKNERDLQWYKRVISGRLWGCSEALSNIKISIDETFCEFRKEEEIFFRKNNDIYNLGKKVIQREKEKHAKKDIAERQVRGLTDEDIERRYRFMENVFIHPHLSMMKKGGTLQRMIHDEKLKRKKNFQTFFTEN